MSRLRLILAESTQVFSGTIVEKNLKLDAIIASAKKKRVEGLEPSYWPFLPLRERGTHLAKRSGGEQEMLAIACGLMFDPRFHMLDELSIGPLVSPSC
jgi:ABC-type branched-subunit amino acid transport system ATPase component